ncbi:SMI1/KNR4 family protein [Actinoplanes regularis]|uniref:SMI1/KNR4 family protein n=1 Tax=Actinoplanes regularis TaxID=52697 RepID=UPI0025532A76|nr:SMI1/KNR4 family protein [Actinoplanes regularis]GLW27652.1 SMI1/KNR4 family protein [Actinoplanes regularis]
MPSIYDVATWEPVLRIVRAGLTEGGFYAGFASRGAASLPGPAPVPRNGRALLVEDMREQWDALQSLQSALAADGLDLISYLVEESALHLFIPGPAVEPGPGAHPGALLLVEGAVPEPWRRLPDPAPGSVPAPTADPVLLERVLRERLASSIGATEAEIAAAEAQLGVALPEELKAVYRVTRARWEDYGDDYDASDREARAVGCELYPIDGLSIVDAAARPAPWAAAAREAAVTAPGAEVQGLAGSPGWIAFGGTGGGDHYAIDLTPGPGGHLGQVILIDHEQYVGASLVASSLTDFVQGRRVDPPADRAEAPVVAHVNSAHSTSIEAAVHPDLEVLNIGFWNGEPLRLAPLAGLPRLRTLTVQPGALADPLEIAGLTRLEYLSLGLAEWRTLLDAGAVPRTLAAAGFELRNGQHPIPVVEIANELLALWDRPLITQVTFGAQADGLVPGRG